jgi:uroporphyrin-III C-methyltransferase
VIDAIQAGLLAGGAAADTPVAVVQSATRDDSSAG